MGLGTVEQPFKMAPFPLGEVLESVVNQALSESFESACSQRQLQEVG